MAYGIIHFYPGGTKDQYETEIAGVHPHGDASLPMGQLIMQLVHHLAVGLSSQYTTQKKLG
jgi:hypothetical protein